MRHVLVAEDDPDVLGLVVLKLERMGFEVTPVTNGTAAVAAIAAQDPDIAVLDISMPGPGGLEIVAAVRAGALASPGLPIVLMSGHAADAAVRAGLAAGADDYLVKPFRLHQLAATIERLLHPRTPNTAG